ncbi:MAG: hypothetical protein RBT20_00020 [Syntrophales bacterium]|jgi:predicted DNA-binding WGR domain protein|nr:hypothetical protein [Syntrophales bacterium]
MASQPKIPPGAVYGVWMRVPSVSGGKDWAVFEIQGGFVETQWGKTGQINQSQRKSFPDPYEALQRLRHSKELKGYSIVAEWDNNSGWTSSKSQIQTSKPLPQEIPEKPQPPKPPKRPLKVVKAVERWMSTGSGQWF